MRKATRAVTQLFDDALSPAGLRSTQLVLLVAVGACEPTPMAQLAEAMVMDRSTLTRNLQPLARSGWVRIAPGRDRRVRLVSLTSKGHQAIVKAAPLWQRAQTALLKRYGNGQWRTLLRCLEAATAAAMATGAALGKTGKR